MIADDLFAEIFKETTQKAVANELYEMQVKGQYLAGLKEPTGQRVRSRDPKTLKEAIDVAVQEAENEKISETSTFRVRGVESCIPEELQAVLQCLSQLEEKLSASQSKSEDHRKNAEIKNDEVPFWLEVCKVGPYLASQNNPQIAIRYPYLKGSAAPLNKIKCFKCGKDGHLARDCKSNIQCFKCQKYGHISRDCRSTRDVQKNGIGDRMASRTSCPPQTNLSQ